MKILITGAAGFIGSHLLHRLVNTNNDLSVIVRQETNLYRIDDIINKVTIFKINSTENLPLVFSKNKFDIVIHLATRYTKFSQGWKDNLEMNLSNIVFPSILLELAAQNNVKAFINTGTCAEYKQSKKQINEDSPILPNNYYAATKAAFESLLKYYSLRNKILGINLKLFYPYGEKDNKKIITLVINSIIKNTPLSVTKGEQKLNFTYVDDLVDAYIDAIKFVNSEHKQNFYSFNIGTDKTHSVREVIKTIEKVSGKKASLSFSLPYPNTEVMYMTCSYAYANKLLLWYPKTTLREGIKKTYEFYANHANITI